MVDIIIGVNQGIIRCPFSVDGLVFTGVILDLPYLAQLLYLVEKMAYGVDLYLAVNFQFMIMV